MDEGLFSKHLLQLRKQKDAKTKIISFLEEKTGVSLEEKDFDISNKTVHLQVSSVKKAKLLQKNSGGLLSELGYTLQL
jgi:type II secretory pathway component PulL